MKEIATGALADEFEEHTDLNVGEFQEMYERKNKGRGSNGTTNMLKYARLMNKDSCFIHYNCDNHITESVYEKLQETEPIIENYEKMIKSAYTMQSKSANRKTKLKKISEKYQIKNRILQNVLDIKFESYNYDAGVTMLEDYEQILKFA